MQAPLKFGGFILVPLLAVAMTFVNCKKMAATRLILPAYFTEEGKKADPVLISLDRELKYITESIIKAEGHSWTLSNSLFNLWNNYEQKLGEIEYNQRLLDTGDVLRQRKEYELSRTHCYHRYLVAAGLPSANEGGNILSFFESNKADHVVAATLRALIGDATCLFQLTVAKDPYLMFPSSISTLTFILGHLRECSEVALRKDSHYWHLHNSLLLTFSACRRLASCGLPDRALPYLIWACVCAESSLPLVGLRYLPLRTNLYVATARCYYDMREPQHAEMFARRCLEKIHQLALWERRGSGGVGVAEALGIKEAAVRLGVLVFKRSVLETRKKCKSIFRSKNRPAIKELLLLAPPRSPTEKLLCEMFGGLCAQLMAVLEALKEASCRPFGHLSPAPVAELDKDTVADVYQELFCIGTDISLKALRVPSAGVKEESLVTLAANGSDAVPLSAVIQFARLSFCYEQYEVLDMLGETVVKAAVECSDPSIQWKGKALSLVVMASSMFNAHQPRATRAPPNQPQVHIQMAAQHQDTEGTTHPPEQLQAYLGLLRDLCSKSSPLLTSDPDLLVDAAVFAWQCVSPVFSSVHSPDACRHVLSQEGVSMNLSMLESMVDIFGALEFWRVDALLDGAVCLKLACLLEARAGDQSAVVGVGEAPFLLYSREDLQRCERVLVRGLKGVERAHQMEYMEGVQEEVTEQSLLHAEYLYTLTRVRVKIATTIAPPPTPDTTRKPSTIKAKVKEQRDREARRQELLSKLAPPDPTLLDEGALLKGCGQSLYARALVLMLEASVMPHLEPARKEALLQDACGALTKLGKHQRAPAAVETTSSPVPPPPQLVYITSNTALFRPSPFQPQNGQVISYYQLFGRSSSGSNIKVRLSDKGFAGLGVQVPAQGALLCALEVTGLDPNMEYVFAVAAYTRTGELVGGAIGETGPPVVACYRLPLVTAWTYCCQCAYIAGVHSVAKQAANVVWKHCVCPLEDHDICVETGVTLYRLKPHPPSPSSQCVLRQFIQSVLVLVRVLAMEGGLQADRLCVGGPLRPSQLSRLGLLSRLVVAMDAACAISEPQYLLQCVVTIYGLLVPILQHGVIHPGLLNVMLRCHATLQGLHESESLLPSESDAAVHHMIAALASSVCRHLLVLGRRDLYPLIADETKALLLATLPGRQREALPTVSGGAQSHHHPGTGQDLSMSHVTVSSGGSNLHGSFPKGGKRTRKQTVVPSTEQPAPESLRSAEYRAFEGVVMLGMGGAETEGASNLMGQEDPVLLYPIIVSMPSQVAYREVYKFRRRPQYLELFVHLASTTLEKGHPERVIAWTNETLEWLTRRNELLLGKKTTGFKGAIVPMSKPRPSGPTTLNSSEQSALSLMKPERGVTKALKSHSPNKTLPPPHSQHPPTTAHNNTTSLVPVSAVDAGKGVARKPHPSPGVRVTKDDITLKARVVIQSLLPGIWKVSRSRKRHRGVSLSELPWRSEVNLLMGTSQLQVLISRLPRPVAGSCTPSLPDVDKGRLRFDQSMVIITGVLPVHRESIPGHNETAAGHHSAVHATPNHQATKSENQPDKPKESGITQELRQMLLSFQRSLVLAHRGHHWVLLQNAARALWNAVTSLIKELDSNDYLVGAVYGLSCHCLYHASMGLCDLISSCGDTIQWEKLPALSSLKFTAYLDDCNTLDLHFIRRLLFMSIEVLYVHQHWEKMVTIATAFNTATGNCWSQHLAPVIASAQEKLAQRANLHREKVTIEALDPAAHLDPQSYNIYGGVSLSLSKVSVPLDVKATWDRMREHGSPQERALEKCRTLYVRYLAGNCVPIQQSPNPQFKEDHTPEHLPLPPSELPLLITAYRGVVEDLTRDGRSTGLAVQALHEMGDLYHHQGNIRLAGEQWRKGLGLALGGLEEPVKQWRGLPLLCNEDGRHGLLELCGVCGCVVAIVLSTKLARYTQCGTQEQMECYLMAAALCKALFSASLPHPSSSDLHYASCDLQQGACLIPGADLFSDPWRCSVGALLSSLQWAGEELVRRSHVLKVLPLLWLYQYVAHTVSRDVIHTARAKILRLQALTELSMFSHSIGLLHELLMGAGLPHPLHEGNKPSESYWNVGRFCDGLPLDSPSNVKVLTSLLEKSLSPNLASLYGGHLTSLLMLAQAKLLTAMASCHQGVPQQSFLSRHPASSSSSSSSPDHTSVASSNQTGKVKRMFSVENIKVLLLEHSERILVGLLRNATSTTPLTMWDTSSHLGLQTRAYLSLVDCCHALYLSGPGARLSLAAMLKLQGLDQEECLKPVAGPMCCADRRLWCECRVALAKSLAGHEGVTPAGGGQQWEEGAGECERSGEWELAASIRLASALSTLTEVPPDLKAMIAQAQGALGDLDHLLELTPSAVLLKCRVSILLADATNIAEGTTHLEMVQVFEGLQLQLKEQFDTETAGCEANVYKPHPSVMAAIKLRLAHTLVLLASRATPPAVDQMMQALDASREGLKESKRSLHTDPCLVSELSFHEGLIRSKLLKKPVAGEEASERLKTPLMDCIENIIECAVDYRLAQSCFVELSQTFSTQSRQANPFTPERPITDTPHPQSSRPKESKAAPERVVSKEEKDWTRARAREAYVSWCAAKAAQQCMFSVQGLQTLTAELRNAAATRPLSEKAMRSLPDFALLDLIPLAPVGMKGLEALPVEQLIPNVQQYQQFSVNWFTVLTYTYKLLQRCFWSAIISSSGTSVWNLHHHSCTPRIFYQCRALLGFLKIHCSDLWSSAAFPAFPRTLHTTPTDGQRSISVAPPTLEELSYLQAGDQELTIVWSSPLLGSPQESSVLALFAFNYKSIKAHPPTNLSAVGIEVYSIPVSCLAWKELRTTWEELVDMTKAFLQNTAMPRPTSRSPSKQKMKLERSLLPPASLQTKVITAVQSLAEALSLHLVEDQFPRLDLHHVEGVAQAILSFNHITVQGDVCIFFRRLLHAHHGSVAC